MAVAKFKINGQELATELAKITRADVYGDSKIRVLGPGDEELVRAGVSENGRDYLSRIDLKYAVTANDEFTLKPMKTVSAVDGQPIEPFPSSFTVIPEFAPATADQVAMLEVATVYHLPGLKLEPGSKFIGTFNYRSGYERKDAVILGKPEGTFMLLGTLKKPTFVGMEVDSELIIADEAEAGSEEGDFGALF